MVDIREKQRKPQAVPILSYFVVVGTMLFSLLLLADYMLPLTDSTPKTSQIVGLQKAALRPEPSHPLMTASNFAAERDSMTEPAQTNTSREKNEKQEKRNRTHDVELH